MRNVLVLQLTRLGDCLQTTPLLATWRHRHPQDNIAVLTHAAFARVFHPNPNVDDVIALESPAPSERDSNAENGIPIDACLQTLASRRRSFDCVINLTHDHRSAALTSTLKPKEILGIYADAQGHLRASDPWSRYLLSLLKFRSQNPFNLVDCYAHLAGGPSTTDRLEFHLEPHELADAAHLLHQVTPGKTLIAFQPGANSADKRWPARRFAELAQILITELDAHLVIVGNQAEKPLAREITAHAPNSRVSDLTGRTTLPQLAAVLHRCHLLVTNDTGTMHLAAAVGTRVIALFQSYVYHRETGPYGAGHWLIQASKLLDYGAHETQDPSSLDRLPVSEVALAVTQLLSENSADERGSSDRLPEYPTARGMRDIRHLRSCFTAGHLDAVSARNDAAADHVENSRWIEIHRPIWLATLDGTPFVPETSDSPDSILIPSTEASQGPNTISLLTMQRLQTVASELATLLSHLLEQSQRDPTNRVSPELAAQLTRLEKRILEEQGDPGCGPFVTYFETTTSTIEPKNLLSYLQAYLQAVTCLQTQLHYLSLSLSLSQNSSADSSLQMPRPNGALELDNVS